MAHLIEHLGKANEANVTRYVLLAHSLGGLLSVAHAQRINNDVTQSIILMDPPPIVRDIQSTAIFKKLEFVWNLSFPLFGFFSITGLFRLTTAIIGSNGYWYDVA
jgi:pimeloyl-ACP methyl ester carboxylesterase